MTRKGNLKDRLRLGSGLVLFVFVVTHLLNHGLGVISYEAMEAGREVFVALWRSLPGTALLLGAILVHAGLGLWKVFWVPSFRMPGWQILQIVLGLVLPVFLAPHLLGTRISFEVLGIRDNYARVLLALWGWKGVLQHALVLIVWLHGCLGIHYWLRFRPWYGRAAPWLLGLAVAIPLWSVAGFLSGGREVQRLAAQQGWLANMAQAGNWPPPEFSPVPTDYGFMAMGSMAGLIALLLAARLVVGWRRRSGASVRVTFGPGETVPISVGTTVLEASRMAGIPHASVCGGRGRCSTCRVRVGQGGEALPPPDENERAVLRRVGAPHNVRLACQIQPDTDLHVTRLLPPHIDPRDAVRGSPHRYGREMEIAILFTDLRGFTTMTERQLAYDVVFLMNRYFHVMGETIEAHGGHLVQVFGDGIMALFGIGTGGEAGCRDALRVARAMAEKLDDLNEQHPLDLAEPLRMGIGVHTGTVIVGEMGYRDAVILTAVGDAVNTTSRLQEATKVFGVQLVVSEQAAEKSGYDFSGFPAHQMDVRGRTQPLAVRAVPSARDLPDFPPGDGGKRAVDDAGPVTA